MVSIYNNRSNNKIYIKNILKLAGGTALGQGIVVIASPLLTRLYNPDDFGILSIYVSILSIFVVISGMRYELAIPLPDDDNDSINLVFLTVIIVVLSSLLLLIVTYLFSSYIQKNISIDVGYYFYWLLPFSLLGAGLYNTFNFWAIRKGYFDLIARTKVRQSVTQIFVQVLCGFFNIGTIGLLIGDFLGRASGSGKLIFSFINKEKALFRHFSLSLLRKLSIEYKKYPLLSTWGGLLNSLGLQMPVIGCILLYGPSIAGFYSLTQRVIGMPLNLIGQSVSQVYVNNLIKLIHERPIEITAFFLRNVKFLFLISSIPILVLMIFGPWIFEVVFGAAWRESGLYLRLLGLMYIGQFAIVPLSQTLNMIGRQEIQFLWDLFRFILGIMIFWLAFVYGLSSRITIFLYGITMFISYVIMFSLIYRELKNQIIFNTSCKKSEMM